MARFLFVLALLAPAIAEAQVTPPADGLYEDFPSIFMEPAGPLAAPPTLVPRWVDVRTTGGITTVTFEPDARVVWRITWGAHGPAQKVTLVDGEAWTTSAFDYDAAGHLAHKTVTGPGVAAPITYDYATDTAGLPIRRTATLHDEAGSTFVETVEVTRHALHAIVTTRHGSDVVRRDRYDAAHRILETRWLGARGTIARLSYRRDAAGALVSITRRIGARRGPADAFHPDPAISEADVSSIAMTVLLRHEAALLLGAPDATYDRLRGTSRTLEDDWSDGCWMNQVSAIVFDPTGLATRGDAPCICGLCVDGALALDARGSDVIEHDLHWRAGAWIRLDGRVDITADHRVMTPDGPVPAGELAAGDVVLDADGAPHVLASVETLADTGLRLGQNLVTSSGTFAAGGLLFESEIPRACAPDGQ